MTVFKKIKKIVSVAMIIVSALVFVLGFTIFIASVSASGGKVPSILGYSVLQVQTGSMEPEIATGSIIVVKETDFDSLQIGDIISFYSDNDKIKGQVNTHRIVNFVNGMGSKKVAVTKGDANTMVDDTPVYDIDVVGKLYYNFGTVGSSVLGVLRNPKIIFIFIILPLIFITFSEAVNLVTLVVESKMEKQKEDNDGKSQEEKN